ncbi:hypothetical protein D9613_010205 [Agrocybe pediades]|uniref:Uncharacterized protein n=1 Tax=Agrocybe pediades TaxID=84607 RepID=A0A8H4QF85_9AGAR|nr:hypothetical protein D9613_010205 [Agrocybe pediades]
MNTSPSHKSFQGHKENRTRARDMIIIGNTGALYFITALSIVVNWIYTNILYCSKGATRLDMFIESLTFDMPLGVQIIIDVTSQVVVYLFADGLLLIRDKIGVEMLSRMWSILLQIITANYATRSGDRYGSGGSAVLVFSITVYRCLIDAKSGFYTIQTSEIHNRLSATTNIAIIWRHTSPSSWSRKHYKAIINALMESSAIYTVAVLLQAILGFMYTGNTQSTLTLTLISEFADMAAQITSGLAPTLMIARLVLSSSEEDTEVSSAHLPSELISHAPHATGTANMTNVGADLEMQQRSAFGVDEQENEEIQMVSRNEYHQPEDNGENRLKNIA